MELTALAIAEYLGGTVEGDPKATVSEFAKIEEATPGSLSFLSNPKYEHYLYTTKATVVLVNRDLKLEKPVEPTLVRVDDSYGALAKLLQLANAQQPRKQGIHPLACVEKSATLGQGVYIGPYVYVGEEAVVEDNAQIYPHSFIGDRARVGEGTTIYAGVKIYQDCEVGRNCIVHAGVVIGADGFGFAPQPDGSYNKIPQMGNVIVADNVEIGANTTIDRAAMGATRIAEGVKLDNLIQVAHNVEIGEHTVIAAQCGIAGSTKVGKHCMFGGQVGLVGHIEITDGVQIGAQTGVSNSIRKADEPIMGYPAMPLRLFYRTSAIVRRLPEMVAELERIKKLVEGENKER